MAALPSYVTCWVALSSARLGEGCIHALPRADDRRRLRQPRRRAPRRRSRFGAGGAALEGPRTGEGGGGAEGAEVDDADRERAASRYAIECAPGDAVVWSGKTVHWGGRVGTDAQRCRVSLAFAFAAPECESEAERIAAVAAWNGGYTAWNGGGGEPGGGGATGEEPATKRQRLSAPMRRATPQLRGGRLTPLGKAQVESARALVHTFVHQFCPPPLPRPPEPSCRLPGGTSSAAADTRSTVSKTVIVVSIMSWIAELPSSVGVRACGLWRQ